MDAYPSNTNATNPKRHFSTESFANSWSRSWLVREDAHWADGALLRLLEFVASEISSVPICVVVTIRTTEIEEDHPIREAMARLTRLHPQGGMQLPALSSEEVTEWVEGRAELSQDAGRLEDTRLAQPNTGGDRLYTKLGRVTNWAAEAYPALGGLSRRQPLFRDSEHSLTYLETRGAKQAPFRAAETMGVQWMIATAPQRRTRTRKASAGVRRAFRRPSWSLERRLDLMPPVTT